MLDSCMVELPLQHLRFGLGLIVGVRMCSSFFSINDLTPEEVDECIIALLQIHPWVDGNGRTASILRNWMLNFE